MCSAVSPTETADRAVRAWNSLSYGRSDVATPWNTLVEAFGIDEARSLVFLVLRADGADDPSYYASCLQMVAERQTEERTESED